MRKETAEEQPSELYDFLYRDAERIASYYAQIWNGRLLSVEESSNESERAESVVKGDLHVASTESKTVSDAQFANKRTIDMHDAATVDLLLRLTAQRAERKGGLGGIHVFSGTCFFLDRAILKYAGPTIDYVFEQEARTEERRSGSLPRQQRRRSEKNTGANDLKNLIKRLTEMVDMPSGFLLQVSEDTSVCGTVKESGLDQPISSLLFRAGSIGLANTYVVGFLEDFKAPGAGLDSPMLRAQQEMGTAFFSILFPANAVRMIPLAIYRKIPL